MNLDILQILFFFLDTIGLWFLFRMCGENKWWALVPLYRFYKLSQCAQKEENGRTFFVLYFFNYFFQITSSIIQNFFPQFNGMLYMLDVLSLLLGIGSFVYKVRIYIGMCDVFSVSKKWVALWIISTGLGALVFALKKAFVYTPSVKKSAASESGLVAQETKEGLSINIKKRTVGGLLNKRNLLKDIHLNIPKGRMVLLVGGSGAGKTTFINAITGFEKADAKILLDGKDVYKSFEDVKYDIGFVPQMDMIRYNDNVRKTVLDAASLRLPISISNKEKNEIVDGVLDEFGLKAVEDNMVGKLSGGQKKRESIAMEFVSNPSLFILDEPDSGLDGVLARDLMEHLHRISREGKIVIVITHSPDRVLDLFDDVIVLAKDADRTGRLVFYGLVEEAKAFFDRDRMEEIVKVINQKEEGGLGMADELIVKYGEITNGRK